MNELLGGIVGKHDGRGYRSRGSEPHSVEVKVYFAPSEVADIQVASARAELRVGSWIAQTAAQVARARRLGERIDFDRLIELVAVLQRHERGVSALVAHVARIATTGGDSDGEAQRLVGAARRTLWQLDELLRAVRVHIQ
ncbi:hypothetical protein [Sciscionella marina]|uniref:hypothetical protein n=1 Tax=Sciscionella marina TaxID=508770 RepID=UPI0012F685BC|nr:hypothetical protein [Sciscionella marina]